MDKMIEGIRFSKVMNDTIDALREDRKDDAEKILADEMKWVDDRIKRLDDDEKDALREGQRAFDSKLLLDEMNQVGVYDRLDDEHKEMLRLISEHEEAKRIAREVKPVYAVSYTHLTLPTTPYV